MTNTLLELLEGVIEALKPVSLKIVVGLEFVPKVTDAATCWLPDTT